VDLLTYELARTDFSALTAFGLAYVGFNGLEAVAWFVIAAWVIVRDRPDGPQLIEIAYALAFVAFGLTDVAEILALPIWLLIAKGAILIAIVVLRRRVIRLRPARRF
jgi:hypothetical protein